MNTSSLLRKLNNENDFIARHNGPSPAEQQIMLTMLGIDNLEQLMEQTVPEKIRLNEALALSPGLSENHMLCALKKIAKKNHIYKSYIGQGYYKTDTPNVILRHVFENPGWYTAYTPYQPEISQGRLESLLNYQQMIIDLTAMDIANASLLDEATAAAEAMTLCRRCGKNKSNNFFVSTNIHPQTIDVVRTRAQFFGYDIILGTIDELEAHHVFGALLQYPGSTGEISDLTDVIKKAHAKNTLVCVASDLLALTLLKAPGEMDADIVIGNTQRFGIPMGFGGPHAAFMATKDKYKRSMPGRIIGVSIDSKGNRALRMAMQTREQHIRRERATSNICTAQALLANMSAFYALHHGPKGLKKIGRRVHHLSAILAKGLINAGLTLSNQTFFDTITINFGDKTDEIYKRAIYAGLNFRRVSDTQLGISLDETTSTQDVNELFYVILDKKTDIDALSVEIEKDEFAAIPVACQRTSAYLTHPVFSEHHSETQMMRYMKQLENKDFSLTHGMIPLGSCTMKLNAVAELIPVGWPEFAQMHPFAPIEQTKGYQILANELSKMLCAITGYDAFSFQPNSGASGEYAGLIAIQRYHQSNGDHHRNICLIPSSAHGTNPASASMLSMKIVVVTCDDKGNIDHEDLKEKIAKNRENLSAIMITYPSTFGVYEESINDICDWIHEAGGQVYLDGANMNAQIGLTNPGFIGSDVSHLNLHKTFAIPHGGGGPGVGPIGVKSHLTPFLPGHGSNSPSQKNEQEHNFAVSAANLGSASILPITYAYIALMGKGGLTQATQLAILNANYLMERLRLYYPVLYRGKQGRVAHECIIDLRPLKATSGISEEDISKRLMDYGFHAPTMSFPVAGTLMIEPTESEDLAEIDRFCDSMIAIRFEITKIQEGEWTLEDNPLVNAPHTQTDLMAADWSHCYSRELACFPTKKTKQTKYWPSVNRVDNVYGDRNLFCSCPNIDSYIDEE
ncbi:MAG: aminomethyl-transferring glycine dehydrogenase [Psychromonas sp.]|nr:aminomethyl-transferring glycine dehydrogenase [Psychromonas sp.]